MTLTQLAEKHNLDPVAFRLAVQEWIDEQPIIDHVTYDGNGRSWQSMQVIARPSLD